MLLAIGVPVGPINDVATATRRSASAGAWHGAGSRPSDCRAASDYLGPVAKLSRTPASVHRAPPPLGYDTEAVLCDLLGYTAAQIEELRIQNAI